MDQTFQSIISREHPVDETLYHVWNKGRWAKSRKQVAETVMYYHQNSLEGVAYASIVFGSSESRNSHIIVFLLVSPCSLSLKPDHRLIICVAMLPCPRQSSLRTNVLPSSTGSKEVVKKSYWFKYAGISRGNPVGRAVACWPLVPKFAGSNPAEAVGFFRAKKTSACLPSEGK